MDIVYDDIIANGLPFPSYLSDFAKRIIKWCLSIDPILRPNFDELIDALTPFNMSTKSLQNGNRIRIKS